MCLWAAFEVEDRTSRKDARKRLGPVNRLLLYGKVPRLGSISSEEQVSSQAVEMSRIIAARLPFWVGKRRKSTEELERKLLKLFRRLVWQETLNQ
jgi:hypothetical protein